MVIRASACRSGSSITACLNWVLFTIQCVTRCLPPSGDKAQRLNDRRIRVSDVEELNRAMLVTGFPYNVRERPDFAREFVIFTMNAQAVRRDGSAAIDLAYVACGRFDGFWEDGLNPGTWLPGSC